MGKITGHVQEYIGRYVVVATIVLLPLSGLLGQLAADWGGADSKLGRVVLGASSVIGTAAAIGVWLRNLGLWETAPLVGQAQGEALAAATTIGGAPGPMGVLEDREAQAAPADVSDAEELAAPPPDESNTPVQPSQVDPDAPTDLPPRVG